MQEEAREVRRSEEEPRIYVLAFESTHAAMAADKAFAGSGAALIPTPRAISAGCGMSLRYAAADDGAALARGQAVGEARGLAVLYVEEAGQYRLLGKL